MLEKLHKGFDERVLKCCFSSIMKMRWSMAMMGLLVWMVNSCATGGGPQSDRMAQESPLAGQGGRLRGMMPRNGVNAEEAFAAPRKERPGLATTFGESRKSPMSSTAFERATSKPWGVDAIYYNNQEGLEALGARNSKISGLQMTAGSVMEWGVRGSFGFLPTYYSYTSSSGRNRRFVEGTPNGRYTIVLKNRCKSALQVVLSVDGLDVIDGKPASVTKRGYVVPAGETLEVEGYRTGYDSVAAFKFSSVSNSYANLSTGDTRNVGVIGLAVYTQKGVDPWTWMPGEIQKREAANPFAVSP
jgi:hypothetical protein